MKSTLLCFMMSFWLYSQQIVSEKMLSPTRVDWAEGIPKGITGDPNAVYYYKDSVIWQYTLLTKEKKAVSLAKDFGQISALLIKGDDLYVAEYVSGNLYKYNLNDQSKTLITRGLCFPTHMIWGLNNRLLVCEFGEGRVLEINGLNNHAVVAKNLASPSSMAILNNELFVVEWNMGRVSKIDAKGQSTIITNRIKFSKPWGIVADQGRLFVTESGNNRIVRLHKDTLVTKEVVTKTDTLLSKAQTDSIVTSYDTIIHKELAWLPKVISNNGLSEPSDLVRVSDGTYFVLERLSKEVSDLRYNWPHEGALQVFGQNKIKKSLQADASTITDKDGLGSFHYQWEFSREGVHWQSVDSLDAKTNIPYLPQEWANSFVRAKMDFMDQGGYREQAYSDALQIMDALSPAIDLSIVQGNFMKSGETVDLRAQITQLDTDTQIDKVEFYYEGEKVATVKKKPFETKLEFPKSKNNQSKYVANIKTIITDKNGKLAQDEELAYVNLTQNDIDGFGGIDDFDKILDGKPVGAYPNPVDDFMFALNQQGDQPYDLILFDFRGERLFELKGLKGKYNIVNLTPFRSGIYIAKFILADGSIHDVKVIKK